MALSTGTIRFISKRKSRVDHTLKLFDVLCGIFLDEVLSRSSLDAHELGLVPYTEGTKAHVRSSARAFDVLNSRRLIRETDETQGTWQTCAASCFLPSLDGACNSLS